MLIDDPAGILLADKPSGPTSHDLVDRVRRRFRFKRVGHCGTLDPQATGLLVLVIGRATKLSERLMGDDKEYEGTLRLGVTTTSQDADGKILAEQPVPPLAPERIEEVFSMFRGDLLQTPPMVSAKKIAGVPLYKLARKGQEVERKPRMIHIFRLEILRTELPEVDFRLLCTKGTYVRTLCHDLGEKFGCGGHLSRLRRTASGKFRVEKAATLETIEAWTRQQLEQNLLDPLSLNLPP